MDVVTAPSDGADAILRSYGLRPFARVVILDERFVIAIDDAEMAANEKAIYAFVVANQIVRIGSSKGYLRNRMRTWERDVSRALQLRPSSTPRWEAEAWREILGQDGIGIIYARPGTTVTTPIGTFSAYLDEESLLIGRHLPRLNRSKHR